MLNGFALARGEQVLSVFATPFDGVLVEADDVVDAVLGSVRSSYRVLTLCFVEGVPRLEMPEQFLLNSVGTTYVFQ